LQEYAVNIKNSFSQSLSTLDAGIVKEFNEYGKKFKEDYINRTES